MVDPVPTPVEVEYRRADATLRIVFSDGVARHLYVPSLRGFCPCARCQGHFNGPHRWVPPAGELAVTLVDAVPVGTYAIGITWEDGHHTGIYTYKNLYVWPEIDRLGERRVTGLKGGETMEEVLVD